VTGTGLLPEVVRAGVEDRTLFEASETFGVVTLVLLIVVLIELEVVRAARRSGSDTAILAAVATPLLVAVVLTTVVRVSGLLG